jgi:hypothetical protein
MPFQRDARYAAEVGRAYGEYLTTYTSSTGQVRAYLFRQGGRVTAHVTFPSGLFASSVTDPTSPTCGGMPGSTALTSNSN